MWLLTFLLSFLLAAEELWLGVGEVRGLRAAPGAPVRVTGRGIVRVIDGERSVRLVAMKPGLATVIIGARETHVRVTSAVEREFTRRLRALLDEMRGLALEFDGDRPVVTGTLLRFSDWRLIADLARRHRAAYAFRARPLRDVGERAIAHFNALATRRGLNLVRFEADPEFTAVVPGGGGTSAVAEAFGPFGVRVDGAGGELALKPLIKTRVVMAEVTRAFGRALGVRWPDEYTARVWPGAGGGGGDVFAALRALEHEGRAQVLASPDLTCRSGGQARFHAGGELPIRTVTRTRQAVEWKTTGVMLEVRPRADGRGNLSLEVRTEVSLVDFAHAVDGVPSLKRNSVESQFDLPGRRTIALSGLIRRDLGASVEGLPFLSQIPLLGRLFSSAQFQRQQSELVVFVTPEVVVPAADAEPTMPAGWIDDGA